MGLFSKIGDEINQAENKVKNANKKVEDEIRKQKQAIIDQEKKIQAEIKKTLKKIKLPLKDMRFLPLLPFKTAMIKGLDMSHIIHNNTLSDIATKFHDHIVENGAYNKSNALNGNVLAPRHTFEENNAFRKDNFSMADFESVDHFNADGDGTDISSDDSGSSSSSQDQSGKYEADAKQTMSLIQKIVAWFKARKEKKEAAKRLKEHQNDPTAIDPIQVKIDEATVSADPKMTELDSSIIDSADQTAKQISNSAIDTIDSKNGTKTITDSNGNITGVHKTGKTLAGFSVLEIVIGLGVIAGGLALIFGGKKDK